MKTNGNLLGRILIWLLFIMLFIGLLINSWRGIFQVIGLYLFLMIVIFTVFCSSNKYNLFEYWSKLNLKEIKIFGITFKWFSNGRK